MAIVAKQDYTAQPVGMIMEGTVPQSKWREITLGECVVINDATYSPKEAWPIINYLDTGNISENRISEIQQLKASKDNIPSRARRKVQPGDIVYSTVRPNQKHFGLLKSVPENFLASTGFAVLRGRNGLADTGFIYWFLAQNHIVDYLHSIAENSTSAYPSIRPSDLEQLTLSLPPLPEQRAIADVLGTLDDKIELNRRMNETLEEMARALFKSWFVDFDPVLAKAALKLRAAPSSHSQPPIGPPPGGSDSEVSLGWTVERARAYLEKMDPSIAALFPDRFVNSELGEIPEGWEVKALGDVANQRRNGLTPEQIDPSAPYIGLEHMPQRSIALSEWTNADGLVGGKSKFEEGDILFGKLRPYFHKVGVAPVEGVCSTDIVVVSPKSPQWFGFVLGHTSSKKFIDYTDAASTGTRMPRTKWKDMALYGVALPGIGIACGYNALIQPWIERMQSAIHESRMLAKQRVELLPRLVSGNVRIG